jgi:hypothetical protein
LIARGSPRKLSGRLKIHHTQFELSGQQGSVRGQLKVYVHKLALLASVLISATPSLATPLYALKEAQNCAGCHKPGRAQRPVLWRRCTLDCQGCHIDPSGGGPRNQWGVYYSYDQLSMRNFFVPKDPLEDRSRFDVHYDGRVITRKTPETTRSFPMSSEFSVRLRPIVDYAHFTYQNLLMGRVDEELFRILNEGSRQFRQKHSIMIDGIPLNTYIRQYRGTPMYGLKRSNHSLWIRERIGLDQFATTDAIELGMTPNVPFFRVSKMDGDPYVESAYRQKGTTAHGGLRGVTLGWHINGSYWETESETNAISMRAIGGGFNAFGVIAYGERNFRSVTQLADTKSSADPHPSSTISEYNLAYGGLRGMILGWMRENMKLDHQTKDSSRDSIYFDIHPIPFLHFEWWIRSESGLRNLRDQLLVAHLYADW